MLQQAMYNCDRRLRSNMADMGVIAPQHNQLIDIVAGTRFTEWRREQPSSSHERVQRQRSCSSGDG